MGNHHLDKLIAVDLTLLINLLADMFQLLMQRTRQMLLFYRSDKKEISK